MPFNQDAVELGAGRHSQAVANHNAASHVGIDPPKSRKQKWETLWKWSITVWLLQQNQDSYHYITAWPGSGKKQQNRSKLFCICMHYNQLDLAMQVSMIQISLLPEKALHFLFTIIHDLQTAAFYIVSNFHDQEKRTKKITLNTLKNKYVPRTINADAKCC